jgi:putative hydrolase
MPGIPNPFGGDLSDLMRMLQSPGPVNMELARSTAKTMSQVNPESGEPLPELPVAAGDASAFEGVVRAVQLAVADTTGLSAALTVPMRCVDRATWARVTLDGLEQVFGSLANAFQRIEGLGGEHPSDENFSADPNVFGSPEALFGMVMQSLVPLMLGGWAGAMIGLLSHHALGQYDLPLPLSTPPELLFVVSRVDEFAEEWAIPVDELRYALALREVVHGAQRSVPWIRQRLLQLSSDYVGAYEIRPDAFDIRLEGLDLSDPASMQGLEHLSDPGALLGAMQSERQAPMLEELQRFVSVLEGYTDVIVATLGEQMVTTHGRVDEALRRHRLERGDATGYVDRLLGLELERAHYERGAAFCRGVVERAGIEGLNRLWADESMAPTPAELDAPGLWLARIDLNQ